ncbi:LuxR family transcriptional regulator [Lentzea aerocolonigenes]|uniref:LuxR family transcriptional regulator n=1 Tax=Lentzea aerocolonigenes TaxID=68170 RepID=A0A0F0HB59_LENAE|nr:LuxR family transcriptional regulator [Lentzea aerocolonigenes]KJK52091.1 LuxR family transcriptional regulator [Lentzea aerocolonigenes]
MSDDLLGRRTEGEQLDRLLTQARSGTGQVLVLRGEAGIGKTALLDHVSARAAGFRVTRAAGVEAESAFPYAGLHQLCVPFLDRLDKLPAPQREALGTAFGMAAGPRPTRFMVGLAVLTLLAEVADEQPLVCLVDDAQWLDSMSSAVLGFVARRLLAERIALVFVLRESNDYLDGLPELFVRGLDDADARALLESVIKGPVDGRVRDRIVAEARGNPLALLELPREVADGLDPGPLTSRIEQSFVRQIESLPLDTRQLLLTAAAEPLGDATLLWRAAGLLGLGADPAAAAVGTGLIEFGARVQFRHPLVRSAVYRSASTVDRQRVHRALADVTDAAIDPDRRAWHRAQATTSPDEEVAGDLENTASRAQARGGLLAAAAFLEQAAVLTPEPGRRADRELAAARAKRDAGALDASLRLLSAVEAGPPDERRSAEIEHLRGHIAFDQRRVAEAAPLLFSAARRLTPFNRDLARETHLEALSAAIWAGSPLADAARTAPPARTPPCALDLVLEALATRITAGYAESVPHMARALDEVRALKVGAEDVSRLPWLFGNRAGGIIATEMWDFETRRAFAGQQVRLSRDAGALVQLQFALNFLADNELLAGEPAAAQALIEEDQRISEVTGTPPVSYAVLLQAAYRGEDLATAAGAQARADGQGRLATIADWTLAILHNGLGRHDLARDAALRVGDSLVYTCLATSELAEAASRTGDAALVAEALERSEAWVDTGWSSGIKARLRGLNGDSAGFRDSIGHFAGTGLRTELARAHLLYGEWLRREGQRVEARDHLRTAHEMLTACGMPTFAERAWRELQATGETARKRSAEPTDELTAQEYQIARLAREGYSNPEIGTRLFISPRTVEWHLRKVFGKLGVTSRRQLRDAAF